MSASGLLWDFNNVGESKAGLTAKRVPSNSVGDAVLERGLQPITASVEGDVDWVKSPISDGGSALSLRGVGGHLRIDAEVARSVARDDFTVAVWFRPLDILRAGIVGQGDDRQSGWGLELMSDGSVRFRHRSTGSESDDALRSPAEQVIPGESYHVAVSVDRDGKCRLFLNGDVVASGRLGGDRADDLPGPLTIGRVAGADRSFHGEIDDLRLNPGALSSDEVKRLIDQSFPGFLPAPRARQPFQGEWAVSEGDVVALVGGGNVVAMQEHGYLETMIRLQAGAATVRARNLAWSGDTVYEQWRAMNFGTWRRQLEHVDATIVMAQFGQMEALNEAKGIDAFTRAYQGLLEKFSKVTRRWVLLSPTPFEEAAPPYPDLTARNATLGRYVAAIDEIADRHGALFVDLFHSLRNRFEEPDQLTKDGVRWTAEGHRVVAREIMRQLVDETGGGIITDYIDQERLGRTDFDVVRELILEKNQLWFRYWRPTNWAFLRGDRTSQPSSRDFKNPKFRWFPEEMQAFRKRIRVMEDRIREAVVRLEPNL